MSKPHHHGTVILRGALGGFGFGRAVPPRGHIAPTPLLSWPSVPVCVFAVFELPIGCAWGGGRFPCDGRRASPATAGVGEGGGSGSGSGSMTPGTAGAGGGRPVAAPVTPTFTVGGASKARPVVLLPPPLAVCGVVSILYRIPACDELFLGVGRRAPLCFVSHGWCTPCARCTKWCVAY